MTNTNALTDLLPVIERHWGYRTLRPLQAEAMLAALGGRDSLVVLPTGGGKSLCYQAPAVQRGGTTVVVSPLIALMKDQVDSLQACGVPAVQLDSSLTSVERSAYEMDLMQGAVRLLFVSPERMAMPDFAGLLRRVGVKNFAIDEAHCISHWGHDFRPEYRQLGKIKELFPGASIHAYTATATEKVRGDICRQLNLKDPLVLVGNFDRANLSYRILPRHDLNQQILEILQRHRGEAGIIYCLRRRDVDDLAALLQAEGFQALGYHAGMEQAERKRVQNEFAAEKCDLIIATVAFGMGIDRSNIRFIIHAAMPKSIEHYQQETGRAGRDGLEAECVLLHSGSDFFTWKRLLEKSAQENEVDRDFLPNALRHLNDLDGYCRGAVCRHKALVNYFGQEYDKPSCAACDICLGDNEPVPDAVILAQKILSCVARVQERFGVNHVIGVLRGENTERIRSLQHDQLSTFGLLKEHAKAELRDWIFQLIGQEVLRQDGDEYPVLKLTDGSWEVMRKQRTVRLLQPVRRQADDRTGKSRADTESWEGVDRGLFEDLRGFRRDLAASRGVPPYVILSDATLRELARIRPSTIEGLRLIYGIGDRKLHDFGAALLQRQLDYCRGHGLVLDMKDSPVPAARASKAPVMNASRALALSLFREGAAIEDVMHQTGRSRSTVADYLADYVRRQKPEKIDAWVAPALYQRIMDVIKVHGGERLKPLYIALEEQVSYDDIRLVLAHLSRNE
jgi:ATP-dependent DNA helicase RecQ